MDIVISYFFAIIGFAKILPSVIIGTLVGWVAIRIIIFFLLRTMRLTKVPKDIRGLVVTVAKLALWVTLIIVMSQVVGLNSLAVAVTGSAAIMAFFLSASIGPLLSNIFSGLFLVGDPDIKAGMRITTNDGKTTGVIKGIDMRKVRIEDDKGLLHVVPNSAVENTEWIILDRKSKK